MKAAVAVGLGFVGLLAVLGGCGVSTYNGLVDRSQAVDGAWGQVENVYQRRADLVPNIVETVKGQAAYEKEVLTGVVEARAAVGAIRMDPSKITPEALERFERAQEALGGALQRLLVVVEKYPELRANEAFRDLRVTLEGAENRIAEERRKYNRAVQDWNAAIRRFPGNLVAGMAGMAEPRPYFKADAGAEKVPAVDLGGGK